MPNARYYKIYDNMYIPGRWHLDLPVDHYGKWVDTWQFNEGRVLEIEGPIRFPMHREGIAIDCSFPMGVPVVHQRVVSLFERLGLQREVQFLPVEVEGQTEPWFILNSLPVIRCIDDARCEEVLYWLPQDNRPDKAEGEYRNVAGLKVDVTKIGEAEIFRPWGWLVVLIVSERVKQAIEADGITGAKFVEV